jgi:FAD synthase
MRSVHNRCVSGLELHYMGMQGMFKSATLYINTDAKILSNKQFKRFCRLKKQFQSKKRAGIIP